MLKHIYLRDFVLIMNTSDFKFKEYHIQFDVSIKSIKCNVVYNKYVYGIMLFIKIVKES